MKITLNTKPRGIILVVTLATIFILALVLTGYLVLVSNQNTSVARSQAWNQAIPVLESGLEEALTQIHFAGTNATLLLSNNWTYGLDGLYHKSRTFPDGSYFNVTIQPSNNPILISTGYVPFLARSSSTNTNYLVRRVRLVAQPLSDGSGGLKAKGVIKFSSGGAYFDSFDSSNPLYSSNGVYVASKHKDNGKISTRSSADPAIIMGSGTIFGSIVTGPGGTVKLASGSIGDASWVASGSGGIQPGHVANDANMQFNDVDAPFTFGTAATPISGSFPYMGTNYDYLLLTGNYNLAGFTLNNGDVMAVSGNAVLYVNGDIKVNAGAAIYIAPGASLTVYMNGDASIAGNGIINATQLSTQCTWYGMAGCTSFSYSGNSAFIGTVYAPNADLALSGGSYACGAFTGNNINISGGVVLHYDEALAQIAKDFVVGSWNEF